MKKKALIFGVTGQDGYYLSKLLLSKNYIVHGVRRRNSVISNFRIDELYLSNKNKFILHYGDITDGASVGKIIRRSNPNEIYNLAAQSHVGISFDLAHYTNDVNATGVLNILENILTINKGIKFYQASTSEIYGGINNIQSEKTRFVPKSPYGIAKLYAYWITKTYRDSYNMFCSNGILFNHESPLRGENFVTRKITKGVAEIAEGKKKIIYLGNIDTYRDWGHAEDYVYAMWKILQLNKPIDLVICTGKTYTVRDFIKRCFKKIGYKIYWKGKNFKEVGYIIKNKKKILVVKISKKYFRPNEVKMLRGDNSLAKKMINFKPKKSINDLIDEMIKNDRDIFRKEQINQLS
tara:strand:- start:11660 stop:12709 length:1050 start_codon:yes stop_codon:yes gene_type:complete